MLWLYYGQENFLCVACKTIGLYYSIILVMLSIYIWMIMVFNYLSCMLMK
jgi:hypothetical protein